MIKRLAQCIRQYKWAAILSPVCMIGEVTMEVLIPLVMANLYDYGIVMQDMNIVITMAGIAQARISMDTSVAVPGAIVRTMRRAVVISRQDL